MSETKFTPGPWRLDHDPIGSGVFSDNENYHGVEAGHGFIKDGVGFNCTGFMSKADARLIAAAPELFEALSDLLNVTEMQGIDGDAEMEAARYALRKARGEHA